MRIKILALLTLITIFLEASPAPAKAEPDLKSVQSKFKQANSWTKRLAVCIDAINNGLIEVGAPVTNIDTIFSTGVLHYGPQVVFDQDRTDALSFAPPQHKNSSATDSWYLHFTFGNEGTIKNYGVSNYYPRSYQKAARSALPTFAEAYAKAIDNSQKVTIIVSAISAHQIQSGVPISSVMQIFHVQRQHRPVSSLHSTEKIYISQSSTNANDGWYFAFTIDANEKLDKYWLSNVSIGGTNIPTEVVETRDRAIRPKPPKSKPKQLLAP